MTMKKNISIIVLLIIFYTGVSAKSPLVILHTNDTHSQLEPYPLEDARDAGLAGIVRREALYRSIRSVEPNVLALDAGDFVQGTPYFNFFKGRAEIQLMNYLKLDAVTLGNHEFDYGTDSLAKMLEGANFPVVCTNYCFDGTILGKIVKKWLVVKKGNLRIGIVGTCVNPHGLIMKDNYEGVKWMDPISSAENTAAWLKKKKKCDIVICLSHLGFDNKDDTPDDVHMAKETRNIDVIIGGHSHTFLKQPVIIKNLDGRDVIVNQVGKGGIYAGRLDLTVGK